MVMPARPLSSKRSSSLREGEADRLSAEPAMAAAESARTAGAEGGEASGAPGAPGAAGGTAAAIGWPGVSPAGDDTGAEPLASSLRIITTWGGLRGGVAGAPLGAWAGVRG